jgi:predicted nucleic acid-binding protein
MEDYGSREALTFDEDFIQAGIRALPLEPDAS